MPRHSLARALLFVLVATLVWTTVTPAEAKRPRRYAGVVLIDWTMCRNGAELTIGASEPRLKLIARSLTHSRFGREQTLARLALTLDAHTHTVWSIDDIPAPGAVVIDNPETEPNEPEMTLGFKTTVKVWWSRPAGRTVNLGLGPIDDPSQFRFATYKVSNCVLIPGTWTESFDALTAWLWRSTTISGVSARE